MNAGGDRHQTNRRRLRRYLRLPAEVFSASENSSQVSYREKFILRAQEGVAWGFGFLHSWFKTVLLCLVFTAQALGFCFQVALTVT